MTQRKGKDAATVTRLWLVAVGLKHGMGSVRALSAGGHSLEAEATLMEKVSGERCAAYHRMAHEPTAPSGQMPNEVHEGMAMGRWCDRPADRGRRPPDLACARRRCLLGRSFRRAHSVRGDRAYARTATAETRVRFAASRVCHLCQPLANPCYGAWRFFLRR